MKRYVRSYEPIFSMATVGYDTKHNITIAVNPDGNRVGDCYFKYYDHASYHSARCVARIDFRKPRKIIHRNKDGKKDWKLNSDDLKILVWYLQQPSSDYSGLTNWQVALYHWNHEHHLLDKARPPKYDTTIKAFVDGFYDTEENLSDPSYLASTLKMPDYTELR